MRSLRVAYAHRRHHQDQPRSKKTSHDYPNEPQSTSIRHIRHKHDQQDESRSSRSTRSPSNTNAIINYSQPRAPRSIAPRVAIQPLPPLVYTQNEPGRPPSISQPRPRGGSVKYPKPKACKIIDQNLWRCYVMGRSNVTMG